MNLLTVDFETYYSKEYSLSKMTTEAYVRDPRFEVIGVSVKVNDAPPVWFSGTMQETAQFLAQFDWANSFVLAHHTAFDGLILSHHFDLRARFYLDTLSMAKPLHAQTIGVSLKALADRYTVGLKGDEVVLAMNKQRLDFTPDDLAAYGKYCCNDVQLTYMLFHILKKEIPSGEIKIIDLMLRMFIEPVLELDTDLLDQHLQDVRQKKEELLDKVAGVGKDLLMSNAKFAQLLIDLGVEPPKKISARTKKETYAFSKTDVAFKDLLEHPDPRVQALVAARLGVKSTIEETRTAALLELGRRGRLPVYLNYYGAHTGRASGGDRINLQNLKRKSPLRRAIRAPQGYVVAAGDSAQIEARVLAWLAEQNDLVRDFANGVDIYSKFASDVYYRPIDRKKNPDDVGPGFVGKTCILGLGFGTGDAKLHETLKAGVNGPPVHIPVLPSRDDPAALSCRQIVQMYRRKYRRIVRFWDTAERALHAIIKGERFHFGCDDILYTSEEGIHLPNGMVIRYPGLTYYMGAFFYASDRRQQAEWVRQKFTQKWEPEKLTPIYGGKVVENCVQALARIIVFDQMLTVAKRFRVPLTVHDEIVACVPAALAEEARQFIETQMSTPPVWAKGLPISCEVHTGETYGDAK